jgi:SecD/SecF fusion protein
MQSKGLVTVLAVLLILVSGYQLLFTWKVGQVEKRAKSYAEALHSDVKSEEYRIAKNLFLDSISDQTVFNLGVRKFTYNQCKANQLNLGLDLQGGMSVVLQVNLKDFLISYSDNNTDEVFNNALTKAQETYSKEGGDFITLFEQNYKALHPKGKDARLAPLFNTRDNQGEIEFDFTNEQVAEVLREKSKLAIQNTHKIISSRIDQFGVTSPNIQLEEKRGRIVVELAGVDNPNRVRNLLQSTANLEFWLMYRAADAGNLLIQANQVIADELALNDALDTTQTVEDLGLNSNQSDDTEEDIEAAISDDSAATDPLATLEGEKDSGDVFSEIEETEGDTSLDLSDEELKKLYPLTSILQLQIDGNQFIEGPVIAAAQIKDTATINKYLSMDKVAELFPETMKFKWAYKGVEEAKGWIYMYAIQTSRAGNEPILDGSVIRTAKADLDQLGANMVTMDMNSEGAKIWCDITGDNVGNYIGILVDNGVVSAPVINGKICGGNTQISGGFRLDEAQDLASMLGIGKLPARAEIVEEEIVGPTLGKENIRTGLASLLFGFLIVVAFMMLYYSGAGVVAVGVLFANIFLIIGVLASLGATLTLPGIAGLVLTVGMAVDANVIIYERIREELLKGKVLRQAISDGYKYSISSILDANVTTLLTAIVLSLVGSGPVKGFAVILIIGILTSLFTAVLVARVVIETYLGKKKDRTLSFSTPLSREKFKNINIDIIGHRKKAYAVTGAIILAGLASIFIQGFELGVDFKGGREYKVQFAESVNVGQIKDALDDAAIFDGGTIVKSFGSDDKVKITTSHMVGQPGLEVDNLVEQKLYNGLKPFIAELKTVESDSAAFASFKTNNLMSSTEINPIISKDFKRSSIWATILSLSAIFLYILIRFSTYNRGGRAKVEYAISAVLTTAHDALFVLAIFSLFRNILPFSLEIDQAFIAALLTVIGYSLNDTVIIFDRIREYLGLYPKKDRGEIINQAVNDTLSRTIITSLTTLFVVAILFVFGGSVIKGFSFALLIGILVGTFSSIFIATPLMYDLGKDREVKVVTTAEGKEESVKQKRKRKGQQPNA